MNVFGIIVGLILVILGLVMMVFVNSVDFWINVVLANLTTTLLAWGVGIGIMIGGLGD